MPHSQFVNIIAVAWPKHLFTRFILRPGLQVHLFLSHLSVAMSHWVSSLQAFPAM